MEAEISNLVCQERGLSLTPNEPDNDEQHDQNDLDQSPVQAWEMRELTQPSARDGSDVQPIFGFSPSFGTKQLEEEDRENDDETPLPSLELVGPEAEDNGRRDELRRNGERPLEPVGPPYECRKKISLSQRSRKYFIVPRVKPRAGEMNREPKVENAPETGISADISPSVKTTPVVPETL